MKALDEVIRDVQSGHALYSKEEVLEILQSFYVENPQELLDKVNKAVDRAQRSMEGIAENFDFDFEYAIDNQGQVEVKVTNADAFVESLREKVDEEIEKLR
jgi:predicted house-cleaning noncanonical NTP pyrophosphatase (MazG superfamily)